MHKTLVTLLLCIASASSWAVQITDLYQGRAGATTEMAKSQAEALGAVLIKLTGKRDVVTQPKVAAALANPAEYVRRYAYQGEGEGRQLVAELDPSRVNQLLSQAVLPILGAVRPQIALWLVIDDSQRRMVSDQSQDGWARELRDSATPLALPVVLPIMDLDDSAAVAVTDVLGRFAEPVAAASQRYGAEMVLLGRLSAEEETWTLEWGLYGSKEGQLAELTKGSLSGSQEVVSEQLTTQLAGWLVEHYGAKVSGEKGQLQIKVEGLSQMNDIAQVQGLIKGMASVASVELAELDTESVTFALSYYGEQKELERALSLDARLAQVGSQPGSLQYRWSAE
ncbi:hypothetical protein G114_06140 [Aeromonas diversa CDC 2478-85]|uniref:DUF2066 domain-containing protein n=1 Tax=Aeromonas diversa CDC 2478-85 TaxID=1268237 RepID=N9VC57_9GAMM|nr:DUF2066 domain-containing protein [Aeromonas diversa]ENY72817.1 hypothetical protein G114_06140 [Aeromonas diversa CDC 2478-85]